LLEKVLNKIFTFEVYPWKVCHPLNIHCVAPNLHGSSLLNIVGQWTWNSKGTFVSTVFQP